MSTQTEFDKELDQILGKFEIGFVLKGKDVNEHIIGFKTAIKQAVDKYVIGEDYRVRPFDHLEPEAKNRNKKLQRLALWGEKK
ncbi:hypothetical protein QN355_11620 [Cryobacterium sp. 10S3]|uniref:hypothetical protein n=1 Tax=Cryobacterium sp. 10S3 TaxID=3048582 RepID=UPI002AC928C0|nr:hypothetical protein [Cryobacterium sp. 10S3]MEB0287202.1 hypothetical protein [Cryobacterium sp. 10S3]WPX14157.1 hypothetical protein RHM57_01940 [Cryobacterium sp. 10S3]